MERAFTSFARSDSDSIASVVLMPKLVRAIVLRATHVLVVEKIKRNKIKDRLSQYGKAYLFYGFIKNFITEAIAKF